MRAVVVLTALLLVGAVAVHGYAAPRHAHTSLQPARESLRFRGGLAGAGGKRKKGKTRGKSTAGDTSVVTNIVHSVMAARVPLPKVVTVGKLTATLQTFEVQEVRGVNKHNVEVSYVGSTGTGRLTMRNIGLRVKTKVHMQVSKFGFSGSVEPTFIVEMTDAGKLDVSLKAHPETLKMTLESFTLLFGDISVKRKGSNLIHKAAAKFVQDYLQDTKEAKQFIRKAVKSKVEEYLDSAHASIADFAAFDSISGKEDSVLNALSKTAVGKAPTIDHVAKFKFGGKDLSVGNIVPLALRMSPEHVNFDLTNGVFKFKVSNFGFTATGDLSMAAIHTVAKFSAESLAFELDVSFAGVTAEATVNKCVVTSSSEAPMSILDLTAKDTASEPFVPGLKRTLTTVLSSSTNDIGKQIHESAVQGVQLGLCSSVTNVVLESLAGFVGKFAPDV